MVTYTGKMYNYTIPNKGSQVIDSPASTFEGLRYREIDMVNSYNYYKFESLKAKSKERVDNHDDFSQTFMLTGNH